MSQPTPSNDRAPAHRYTALFAGELEVRWQAAWMGAGAFRQANPGEAGFDANRPKFYCLDMFPYPSGAGLHVGHPEGYTATDIISRFKRMKGFNVLHPMGWDAFGLPAEQYAIQTGIHPAVTTKGAIENFRRQLQRFGFSYDWSREFGTIDPEYYRWTQWIFLKLFNAWYDPAAKRARHVSELEAMASRGEVATPAPWGQMSAEARRAFVDSRRLAYQSEMVVNWCPKLGTVLANDEVIDGRSERGGFPVVRKPLKQWVFRITEYADRLVEQLALLEWPESTKAMQSEWIGRSEGAEVEFELDRAPGAERRATQTLRVFTTRPDTLFGATYMVVAPEHPLVTGVLASPPAGVDVSALRAYVERTRSRSDIERQEAREKTGVFTGVNAINPATGEPIPVWAADYVLMGYGTGAIMAVPAHDARDYEFAKTFGLPVRIVVDRFFDEPAAVSHILHQHFALGKFYAAIWMPNTNPDVATPIEEIRARLKTGGELVSDAGHGAWGRVLLVQTPMEDAVLAVLASPCRQYELSQAHADDGRGVNSSNAEISLDGLTTSEAKERIVGWLEKTGRGRRKVNYRLRDWVFSRQRYWGEPFPIVYDEKGNAYPVDESHLPVRLPDLEDYAPVDSEEPQPLLAKATSWVNTTAGAAGVSALPPETPVRRETNTMPGSAGSSWYAVRYCDAHNAGRFVGKDAEQYWMGPREGGRGVGGVDLYVGGSEHAVGHLLYARFWQNVLFDLGEVSTPEPFRKLFHQGLITSFAYQRADKTLVPVDQVSGSEESGYVETATGQRVTQIVAKMSKSLKNVVNPDDVIAEFGADTFRLYEMYMGPLEASKPWNPRDITGLFRFLQRAWRVAVSEESGAIRAAAAPDEKLDRLLHRLIAKAGADIERMSFNTAIAAMIEFVNACVSADKGQGALTTEQLSRFALVLSPFAPHLAEEMWARAGNTGFAMHAPWPAVDESKLTDDTVEVPVQVAGKVRSRVMVPAGADVKAHEALALADERVKEFIAGKPVRKVIVVPGKMVNVVV